MATRVLLLSLLIAPLSAQPPSPYQDLAAELAVKIAAALPPGEPAILSFIAADGADRAVSTQAEAEIRRAVIARGVRIVDRADAVPIVRVTCYQNLRERACVADVQKGATRSVAAATRPLDSGANRAPMAALAMQPIFTQRAPILDVAVAGDHVLVLDPESVTRYQRTESGWQRADSQPIRHLRVWPRDVRGRLRVDGARLEVFLPGVVCRGASDATRLACADERDAWPIGIENTGIEANRNYFSTPEGLTFFGAAALGPDADARWIAAGSSGALLFLDDSRRSVATIASGDDVAAMSAPCVGPVVLVAASSRTEHADTLRLFRGVHRQLIPAAAPLELPGRFAALWPTSAPRPDSGQAADTAIAVSHDARADRYDAFQIRIACDR